MVDPMEHNSEAHNLLDRLHIPDIPLPAVPFFQDDDEDEVEQVEHFKYKQDLQRKLTVTSVIGLGFTVMGVPFGISSTLWISLIDGGNVTMLYGWIVTAFFSICVVLSLSEIISKYPTAGGVYHFSAILSNDRYSLICSWYTGWFLLIGNWLYAVSNIFAGSQFILSILGLRNAYYKQDVFLVEALYFLILAIVGYINFRFSKYLEKINKVCIAWSIYTILAIDILLIVFAKHTNPIKKILSNFDNSRSGWPNVMAFLVGLQSPSFTLTGYGMLFSMTDEVKNPERNMPKGAISSIILSSLMGLAFIIPLLVILPDLELLLDKTPEVMPIDLVFKVSTESYVLSFLLVVLLVVTFLFQAIGSLTTASRSTYAFARDGGLPFSHLLTEVDSVEDSTVPKNALFLSLCMCGLFSLLSLVSSSAFNSFLGSAVICLAFANGVPILCLMLNKRQKLKGRPFRLRRFGWMINTLAVFWVIFSSILLCLPPVLKNLTWYSMNYSFLVILCFFLYATGGYYWWGKKSFQGPQIDTDYFAMSGQVVEPVVERASEEEMDGEVLFDQETTEMSRKVSFGEGTATDREAFDQEAATDREAFDQEATTPETDDSTSEAKKGPHQ